MPIKLLNNGTPRLKPWSPPADSLRPLKSLYDFKGLVPGMLRIPRDESKRWPSRLPCGEGFIRLKIEADKGFTLVEVLIAIGILAVVIVGLLQLFVYCSTLAQAAGNTTLAVNEAQNKIEEIRSHNFSTIAIDYASGGTPGNTFALTGLNGTGTITTSQVGGSSELLQIQINVNWQNQNSRSFSTALTGLVARR